MADILRAMAEKVANQKQDLSKLNEQEQPGIFTAKRLFNGATTADEFDGTLFAETTIGTGTVNLPTAVGLGGRIYVIADKDGNAVVNNITIDAFGAETINGALTRVILVNYGSVIIQSDGSDWIVIAAA
jgi:hypothetical protein